MTDSCFFILVLFLPSPDIVIGTGWLQEGKAGKNGGFDLISSYSLPLLFFFTLKFSVLLQPNQIVVEDNILVSRYISNPLLIDGESA